MNEPRRWLAWAGAAVLGLGLGLSSCAIAPARLTRVIAHEPGGRFLHPARPELHALLETALKDPNAKASKAALGRFVEQWKQDHSPAEGTLPPGANEASKPAYHVVFDSRQPGSYALDYFDEISPADGFKVHKIAHHHRDGVGTPMSALRENRHREPIERYYPPEAITRPLTAVAAEGPVRHGVCEVRIQLLCPMVTEAVMLGGRRGPLAADFSVPWAAALARTGKLNQSKVLDMLTPLPRHQPQLYLMEPYDPHKEPLIMIHGLLSTPLAWAGMCNDLWADAQIRERYQIWHFLYNTSAPALYSARILRSQLHELRTLLDPDGRDPAMQKTTLLTHSMGGLVGKTLVMRPGDAFLKAAFTAPLESLQMSKADRIALNDAFNWQPDPTVHRIIFISVPHRGAAFVDNLIGRMGSALTRPPLAYQTFFKTIDTANPGAFTPGYVQLGRGELNGVHALSPRQPSMRILASLPLAKGVQVHSIIGNGGRSGPLATSSDNLVRYSSSHLDNAASELIVPTGHRAFRHPLAVAEVRRILKLP